MYFHELELLVDYKNCVQGSVLNILVNYLKDNWKGHGISRGCRGLAPLLFTVSGSAPVRVYTFVKPNLLPLKKRNSTFSKLDLTIVIFFLCKFTYDFANFCFVCLLCKIRSDLYLFCYSTLPRGLMIDIDVIYWCEFHLTVKYWKSCMLLSFIFLIALWVEICPTIYQCVLLNYHF